MARVGFAFLSLYRRWKRAVNIFIASKIKNNRLWAHQRDVRNRLRYGLDAPRYAEPINIPTRWCVQHAPELPGPGLSGAVLSHGWPYRYQDVLAVANVRFCVEHWGRGLTWEATGAFERMQRLMEKKGSIDGCQTMDDVRRRYAVLDEVFDVVRREGRLRRTREMKSGTLRARGDLYFHIGPDGEPVFGGYGCHRLAMAIVLDLPTVPAQLGCVHELGIQHLALYRTSEEDLCQQVLAGELAYSAHGESRSWSLADRPMS